MKARGALVDAFIAPGLRGNPAYVLDCGTGELTTAWMQELANELNQAETAFIRRRGPAEFSLRWFTPTTEVELCGHATLASAAWLWENEPTLADELRFATRSGTLLARRRGDGSVALTLPTVPFAATAEPLGIGEALGGVEYSFIGITEDPNWLERNLGVLVDARVLRNLTPNLDLIARFPVGGFIVTASSDVDGLDFLSRYFAPACGIPEDHVTGSAHCSLAPYWAGRTGKVEFDALQASPRGGQLRVTCLADGVQISGHCRVVTDVAVR